MGARLALTRATVTNPDGVVLKDRNVQVLGSLLRVLDGPRVETELSGVDTAVRVSQKVWRVELTNGTSWLVERGKGCGCRGR